MEENVEIINKSFAEEVEKRYNKKYKVNRIPLGKKILVGASAFLGVAMIVGSVGLFQLANKDNVEHNENSKAEGNKIELAIQEAVAEEPIEIDYLQAENVVEPTDYGVKEGKVPLSELNQELLEVSKSGLNSIKESLNNEDIVCLLEGEGVLDRVYAVPTAPDNNYYLNHNIDKTVGDGSLFIFAENDNDDQVTKIGGHNYVNTEVQFSQLDKYNDASFFNKHQTMHMYGDGVVYELQIFSVAEMDGVNVPTNYGSEEECAQVMNDLKAQYESRLNIDTGVDIEPGNRYVAFYTCLDEAKFNQRLLAYAKIVKVYDIRMEHAQELNQNKTR